MNEMRDTKRHLPRDQGKTETLNSKIIQFTARVRDSK